MLKRYTVLLKGKRSYESVFCLRTQLAPVTLRAFFSFGLYLLCMMQASVSHAQQALPPQEKYFIGEGEVDLYRGVFLHSSVDISIGDDGSGLSVERYHGVRSIGGPFGLSTGHSQEVRVYREQFLEDPWGGQNFSYRWHVVIGRNVEVFDDPYTPNGSYMAYIGTSPGYHWFTRQTKEGPYTYFGPNGLVIQFGTLEGCPNIGIPSINCALAQSLTRADGTSQAFSYDLPSVGNRRLRMVENNHGFALGFNYRADVTDYIASVCAFRRSNYFASTSSPCPSGARLTTYQWQDRPTNGPLFTGFNAPGGVGAAYGYDTQNCFGITSVSRVGDSLPFQQISYNSLCQVSQNSLGSGSKSITYTYANTMGWDAMPFNEWTVESTGGVGKKYYYQNNPEPWKTEDELGRTTIRQIWEGCSANGRYAKTTHPEGNVSRFNCDGRSNRTEERLLSKPGSSLGDIVTTAAYPTACQNPVICDKPLSRSDALSGVTVYIWDPVHGGQLSEMGPAPVAGAARPLKLTTWTQRYAWVRNSGGALVQAATPVWLKSSETVCQTVAGSSSATCDPTASQTVVSYEYGASGTAESLLLKGTVASSGGTNLRTCYRYDALARKISETAPKAGLGVCP